jgi:hypothetical protein
MAATAPVQKTPNCSNQAELDSLAEDFFHLAESQLAKMKPEERETVIASIHATAESLRAEK